MLFFLDYIRILSLFFWVAVLCQKLSEVKNNGSKYERNRRE